MTAVEPQAARVERIETAVTAIRHAVEEGWFSTADGEALIARLRNPAMPAMKPDGRRRAP